MIKPTMQNDEHIYNQKGFSIGYFHELNIYASFLHDAGLDGLIKLVKLQPLMTYTEFADRHEINIEMVLKEQREIVDNGASEIQFILNLAEKSENDDFHEMSRCLIERIFANMECMVR